MSLKRNILANYVSLAHVPNPSIPVSGFLERRGCFYASGTSVFRFDPAGAVADDEALG
ncbi:MAG: hypothetical protein WAV07_02985 [Candidatus Contendobacter sp.]